MKNSTISRVMRAMGKKGGKAGGPKGGRARMHRLTPQQRKELARNAAAARWGNAPNKGGICAQSGTLETAAGLAARQEFDRRTRFSRFIEQAKDFDYRKWNPTIPFGVAEPRSDADIINDAESDRFRYLHSGLDAHGILQFRFMLTCQELNVPEEKWPQFGTIVLPDPGRRRIEMPPFSPPPFDALRDSAANWREPTNFDWLRYPRRAAIWAARQYLPRPFRNRAFHYQYSASAGIKPGLRLHFWFWLEDAMNSEEVKRYLRAIGNGRLDLSLYNPVQPHYTAAPVFIGLQDPLAGRREGLIL